MLKDRILDIFFPAKCLLCQRVLSRDETDLCHNCRKDTEEYPKPKHKISFVAGWTAMWYYNGNVRHSLLLYKFYNRRSYGAVYGRLLAMMLSSKRLCDYDILTWVPVSRRRRWLRGYDQVELIAKSVGAELGVEPVPTLKKIRHNRPQSRISDGAKRRANVLGAYRVISPESVAGKNVLLIDDVITTGATASECARVLTMAGAAKVTCAAVAAAPHDKKENQ